MVEKGWARRDGIPGNRERRWYIFLTSKTAPMMCVEAGTFSSGWWGIRALYRPRLG
jgi:hypothetical protein